MTRSVPEIFGNLKVYGSHLVIQWLDKLDLKLNLILIGLGKHIDFRISLVLIDSMQFKNSSLTK